MVGVARTTNLLVSLRDDHAWQVREGLDAGLAEYRNASTAPGSFLTHCHSLGSGRGRATYFVSD